MNPDPGTRVADRYLLERQLVDVPDVTLWRAHDEILDRPVALRTVATTHPRAHEVLDAARSTSRVDDLRIARVLDAAENDDHVYVVTAWAAGTDLAALLADGPLEPDEAIALVAEVADVVAYAHQQDVAHLALDPTNVVVGAGDEVTVLGLAVDAVLQGDGGLPADPAQVDARGLGGLLYACLTARWPIGDDGHGLALAPRIGDRLCTPRQVRAAVPSAVDLTTRRALGETGIGAPLDRPADVATALGHLLAERSRGRWRRGEWFGRRSRTADER